LTLHSLHGQSKTISDTEKVTKTYLPTSPSAQKTYRVVYAVHKLLESRSNSDESALQPLQHAPPSEFIGLVVLKSSDTNSLALPSHLTAPPTATPTLTLELAYMFLPPSWSHGYATEALTAVFSACTRARAFWTPFEKVYVSALVNEKNGASQRVVEKVGMERRGVFEWSGEAVWLAGEWRVRDRLVVFGGGMGV